MPIYQTLVKRKLRADILIAIILLLIPLSVGIYCFLPQYYRFTALGEIVSVREIGLKGSVNFCYIREGITRNLYERWTTGRALPDAVFETTDSSAENEFVEITEVGKQARNETIRNAVISADAQTNELVTENEFEQKLDSLIEKTVNYYGDSLGLMLGIGLVEEAQKADFSENGKFIIAGTGTMEADHTVGSVGGIRDKLRTAEKYGADYFFVPKDKDYFPYEGLSNEEEAALVSQELHLHFKIVPVATLEEALNYLKKLKS